MRIIPFQIYTLKTPLTQEEIKDRLQKNIATGNFFKRHYSGDEIYEGGIVNDYFEIKMITAGRIPFKAIVGGKMFNEQEGTMIKIKIRMEEIGIVFSALIAVMFILSLCFLVGGLINNNVTSDEESAVIIFFVLIAGIVSLYNLHAEYIKQNLRTLFQAEPLK